jgi:hypothetical protein
MKNYSSFTFKSLEFIKKDFLFLLISIYSLILISAFYINAHVIFICTLVPIIGFLAYKSYLNFKHGIILEYSIFHFLYSIIFFIVLPALAFLYGFFFISDFSPNLEGLKFVYYGFTAVFSFWMFSPVVESLKLTKSAHYRLVHILADVYKSCEKLPELTYVENQIQNPKKIPNNKFRVGSFLFSIDETFWNETSINYNSLISYSSDFGIPLTSLTQDDIEMIKMMSI